MGRVLTIWFLIILPFCKVIAQEVPFRFTRLKIPNAPRLSTKAMYHDREGYIWFGSWHGLNRFDGYKIRYYTKSELSNTQFESTAAKLIFEDRRGDLWIATDAGSLMIFNRKLDRFEAVNDSSTSLKVQASSYAEDDSGNFWISTLGAGLFYYNAKTKQLKAYAANPGDALSLSSNLINEIAFDREQNLWIATDNGLCRYNKASDNFTRFQLKNNHPSDQTKHKSLQALHISVDGKFYLGSLNGLHIFDSRTSEDTHLLNNGSDHASISHNEISDILELDDGSIWVATVGGGINIYNKDKGDFHRIQTDPKNPDGLPSDFISKLYIDSNKTLWVSTFESGIVLYNTTPEPINCIRHNPNDPNSLPKGNVFAILPANDSIVWVGLSRGGLNRLNIYTGKNSKFLFNPNVPAGAGNNTVEQIRFDKKGNLWIGAFDGGLNKFDPTVNSFTRYLHDAARNSISNNSVGNVLVDQSDNIWISHDIGVDVVKSENGKIINFPDDSLKTTAGISLFGSAMTETPGRIWFIRSDQLIIFDKKQGAFVKVQLPLYPSNAIPAGDGIIGFFKDRTIKKLMYSAAGEMNTETILQLNDEILAMCADQKGILWALTVKKVLKIDPDRKTYKEIYYPDELPNEPIFPDIVADPHGKIFFSFIDELCWFFPDQIENQRPPLKVVFSDFKVFNNTAIVSDTLQPGNRFVLKKHISQLDVIELSHRESFFSFEFTALEYLKPQKLQYAYKMEGFDEDWINIGNRNFVSYTSLNPGEYTFKVKAAKQEGIWSDQIASIRVVVYPPFWKTWWFISLEIMLIISLAYAFLRYKIAQSVRLERLRNKIASDLHDEVGSSLTRISIYADLLQNGLNKKEGHAHAHSISSLSRDIINTMSDIIWSIDDKSDNLGDLIIRMKDFATEVLRSKHIEIEFEVKGINEKKTLSPVLKQNLYLIFKESINNIIKHSDSTLVHVLISNDKNEFVMIIHDNGKGIHAGTNAKGRGLSSMEKRAVAIDAELNVLNFEGTTIQLKRKPV